VDIFVFSSPILAGMGLDVGGYHEHADWPKMGPSLVIASCLILAIRTAKWPPRFDTGSAEHDLNTEIEFAIKAANRVLMTLATKYETIFPQKKEPWYRASEEDLPE